MSNAVAHAEPVLLSHFDDLQQQDDSTKLGMWTFLATEVMFFGGMFLAYILFRWKYHGAERTTPIRPSCEMWTFLATEVKFFGGMFTAYILFRSTYHAASPWLATS